MRAFRIVCIAAAVSMGLAGCVYYTKPIAPEPKLTGASRNFQAFWQATIDVLRKYNFELDRQDRRAGVITTQPLLGKHFFEVWRHDTVGARDLAESSLQSIYRTVTVSIRPTAPGAPTYKPVVQVQLHRSNREYLGVVSTTDAYDMFILPGRDELRERKILAGGRHRELAVTKPKPPRRVKVGPQRTLADKLAADIRGAAAKRLAGVQ
jgi:hypothetical protein